MPGIITHYICGEAVIKELSDAKEIIKNNRQFYNIGTQGPDIFFYNYPMLLRKSLNGLGTKMHTTNFNMFFDCMLNEGKDLSSKSKDFFFSYLSGYLTHYALDCETHPYIYYKSGFRKGLYPTLKELKYSAYHRRFETAIDVLMLKLVNSEKPSDKELWQLIKINKNDALEICNLMSRAIQGAYQVPVSGGQICKAMAYMWNTTRILQSKNGRRKKFIEFAENISIREKMITGLIHDQEISDDIDYLNTKKRPWYKPWDNTLEHNSTFTELFDKAVKDSTEMINCFYDYMYNNIEKEKFLSAIGNNSFASGVDSSQNIEFLFSDIVY